MPSLLKGRKGRGSLMSNLSRKLQSPCLRSHLGELAAGRWLLPDAALSARLCCTGCVNQTLDIPGFHREEETRDSDRALCFNFPAMSLLGAVSDNKVTLNHHQALLVTEKGCQMVLQNTHILLRSHAHTECTKPLYSTLWLGLVWSGSYTQGRP